ncbi:hypothetical protein [Vibrio sp. MEBiC08052]|uniref:hypothetical protein n=1 Tax=Vibrio sp. MEBiC08052 TaxID=1761910 RepID=UPI0007407043|nr:hypothetical protein [Vibrio sp. MEBiC08052]KUJ00024.1 hypothetical protein VRK_07360 [Vibrio sp. MEBiC08052]
MNDGSWADFFPYFAGAFKIIVLGIVAYLAIKWHFDEERRVREAEGAVFDTPSAMKKLSMIFAFIAFFVVLIVLVVYATNWVLY